MNPAPKEPMSGTPEIVEPDPPVGSAWPEDVIAGAARAMHASTCCPMDESSQCKESDLPIEDARAALEFVAPAVVAFIASRQRIVQRNDAWRCAAPPGALFNSPGTPLVQT